LGTRWLVETLALLGCSLVGGDLLAHAAKRDP
jgi:hypothetical protein